VRTLGDRLIVDDPHTYGPTIKEAADGGGIVVDGKTWLKQPDVCPAPTADAWRALIGEYGWDHNVLYIYEHGGQMWALIEWFYNYPLVQAADDVFAFPNAGLYPQEQIVFQRNAEGAVVAAVAAGVTFPRRGATGIHDGVFRVRPPRPIEEIRAAALAAEPPREVRTFRKSDLVEPTKLDGTINLDIRYATADNFTGTKIYESARAYLQRPAAEALVRVSRALEERGYGLVIHDAYRPWHVTKMFWDATPDAFHAFVANPAEGSRHNRGCAVDLTLYRLDTGKTVDMPGVYDEMSSRSYPLYPGGEHAQRWHRDLLRAAMEAEGFTVYETEWWHFDYKDWRSYPIGNQRFEDLDAGK
jgi:D-alanyl-D-alanine dipeptidase